MFRVAERNDRVFRWLELAGAAERTLQNAPKNYSAKGLVDNGGTAVGPIDCRWRKEVEELTIADLRRSLDLMRRYEDAQIGFVDATVVAIAERLKLQRILTTDRRDFSLVRPCHCKQFELLP